MLIEKNEIQHDLNQSLVIDWLDEYSQSLSAEQKDF